MSPREMTTAAVVAAMLATGVTSVDGTSAGGPSGAARGDHPAPFPYPPVPRFPLPTSGAWSSSSGSLFGSGLVAALILLFALAGPRLGRALRPCRDLVPSPVFHPLLEHPG
jgi:hypothetical protein